MTRLLAGFGAMITVVFSAIAPSIAEAAAPTAEQALKLAPTQRDVDYDRPTPDRIAQCKIVAKKIDGRVGWIVEGPDGAVLRKFIDTNGDNVVDQWSYFKNGLEVYRDIDANFNGKVDQCRWFNIAGGRWGVDANEDGEIDSWKSISAEEVAAEVVAALAARDTRRFARLLLAPEELKTLGASETRARAIAEKLDRATSEFSTAAARQKVLGPDAAWTQFSGGKPGVIPAGTDGSTRDLRVYENAVAIAESAGRHVQVQIGTLVQVGDAWRAIDLPHPMADGQAEDLPGGFFFQASLPSRDEPAAGSNGETPQKLLTALEELDGAAAKATSPADQAKYIIRRAELLEQIADASKNADDRAMWIRQLADMIGAAIQMDNCPDGAKRLKSLFEKLDKNPADRNLAAYVKFRQLTADYVLAMQAPKPDYAKIQADWIKSLEQFVSDYATASDASEAMLQLGVNEEFEGEDDAARKWYARIVKEFPDAPAAKKAAGAQYRLDSVGKVLAFSGQSPAGGTVDLAKFRGKVVLIQFWSTRSTPARSDMATLKELWNKYGRQFTVIGVNLDHDVRDLNAYLAENPLPWPQIHEPGGSDSRPANALGIFAVPTMILVDQQGKVVNRGIAIADLEAELKRLIQ